MAKCIEKVIHGLEHSSGNFSCAEYFFSRKVVCLEIYHSDLSRKLLRSSTGQTAQMSFVFTCPIRPFQSSSEYKQIHLIRWKNCIFFVVFVLSVALVLFGLGHVNYGPTLVAAQKEKNLFDCEIRYDCLRCKREYKPDNRTNWSISHHYLQYILFESMAKSLLYMSLNRWMKKWIRKEDLQRFWQPNYQPFYG